MERFTNQYEKLIEEIEKEISILVITEEERCVASYSEIPSIAGSHFSLFLVEDLLKKKYKIVEKVWNTFYDSNRFSSGIFNLDRISIKEKSVDLSINQQEKFKDIIDAIKNFPETLESTGYILLDGIDHVLSIKTDIVDKSYRWKVPTESIKFFIPLIDFLKTLIVNN